MCLPMEQEQLIALNEKGFKLKTTMHIVLVFHAIFALLKMFILNPYSSIGDIISCMILYCGVQQHNFCTILIYMIFCLLNSFQLATMIGYLIQTGAFGSTFSSNSNEITIANGDGLNMGFIYGFVVVMFTFYVIAVYCSFQTYKEFKAIYQEEIGNNPQFGLRSQFTGQRYGGVNDNEVRSNSSGQNSNRDRQVQNAFKAFQGEGKRLGDY